jgi:precorrin-3B synthase
MTAAARAYSPRRGACPGLTTPMPTGDGLLARLLPAGTISLAQMADLAAAALRHGNGIIEITSRGSIQVRGLRPDSAPAFADAVAALGVAAHDGVPIICDALAGLDPQGLMDAGALARRLRGALDSCGITLHPKVSVAIDGGGPLHLDAVAADIRLRALEPRESRRLHIAVGGDAASAAPIGTIARADAIDTVVRLLRKIAAHGPQARARDAIRAAPEAAAAPARDPAEPIGQHHLRRDKVAVGVGFPFGHTTTGLLTSLLRSARERGATGLRPAPGRALLVIGLTRPDAQAFTTTARQLDYIVEPGDPRRRLIACAGAPICASGEIEARALAPEVAREAMLLTRPNETVHVSGCRKSCAYQGVATLTAVGRNGACDLFIEGAPAGSCESWQLARRLGQIVFDRLPKPKS